MPTHDFHLKYILIDDDEIDRAIIENEADKFPFLQRVASCSNPVEAIEIIARFNPEVLFLDIEMPALNGLQLVRKIKTGGLPVFITSHPEFALEGFELEAFDYLLKPVISERFARCAYRLREFYELKRKSFAYDEQEDNEFIVIKQGYDKYKIPMHEIIYLEAMRDYTKIATVTGQYLVLTTLSGLIKKLPADMFVRIHRSYVVNRKKVDAIQKNKLYIQSQELPIGKLYKHAFNFSA